MASWKTIVFLKTKPRKKSFRESFTFRAPTEQPRLFYDMVDPDLKNRTHILSNKILQGVPFV